MGEKRNDLNLEDEQLRKKVKRKVLKWDFIITLIMEVIITVIILFNNSLSVNERKFAVALAQISVLCEGCLLAYPYYLFILEREKAKMFKSLAKDCLSTTKWVQVIPVKADDYREFILNELPKRGKFFARQREDSDVIDVSLKFDNEQEYIPWEKIDRSLFFIYYSIIEESEEEA